MLVVTRPTLALVAAFSGLVLLHFPLLKLPYFWDEAGYYIPAALDFYHKGSLIPESTLPTGHTPLVMVYLALAWKLFGFSPVVTRVAMILVAAATVVALYTLARRVTSREPAVCSALLLAVSPLFFAQSSMAHLDLAAALFTLLAVLALIDKRWGLFALAASLAVLSKETAVVLLPVAWASVWWEGRARHAVPLRKTWIAMTAPLLPLAAWTLYYHHATGYWTGNPEYLQYNLYSTLEPGRVFWSLLRRLYELFIGGFHWLLVGGAMVGLWWERRSRKGTETQRTESQKHEPVEAARRRSGVSKENFSRFIFITVSLAVAYVLMLSVVGGAILPRYLLPVLPLLYVAAVRFIWQLPRAAARAICGVAAGCFVWAWFLNPPYPFPLEDNLAYADFIRLHQKGASFLEAQAGEPRILTAWPATDELSRPFLGYVGKPLHVVAVPGFREEDLSQVQPDSFDLLYLYSRKWDPAANWLDRFSFFADVQKRYFDYAPQVREGALAMRFGLKLVKRFERRGQWVSILEKTGGRSHKAAAGRATPRLKASAGPK